MSRKYSNIPENLINFIKAQKIFFVATATQYSRINLSPKGMDSLRVLDENRIIWLNVTGSGNETSHHIQEDGRMTLMFNAFEKKPLILRIYGRAKVIHKNTKGWDELYSFFNPLPGVRQIFDLRVELVQSSCGTAVPYYDYVAERDGLNKWAIKKGEKGIKQYWEDRNSISIDGKEIKFF